MPPRDPDEMLVVVFKLLAMENSDKTLAEGRPVYDDVEVCEIRAPGSKDIKVFPSTAFCRWVEDPFSGQQHKQSYAERFSHQYRQFKSQSVQTKSGTPLDYATFLTDARRAELRAQNVYTVEMLAGIDGNELKNLGPGGRDMKNKAIEFIDEAKATAPTKQMLAELEAMRARNAILEEDNAALKAQQETNGEFEEMTTEQLRDYIATTTGHAPHGSINKKTLVRMAAASSKQEQRAE